MALLGVRAAVDLVQPVGIDAQKIWNFTVLRDTVLVGDLLRDAAAIMGRTNEELFAKYSGLFTITDDLFGMTAQGQDGRTMTPEKTEYRDADAVRTEEIGHMLPLKAYDDATGWTEEYLLDARRSQVANDLQLIRDRWLNRFDYQMVLRMLTNTENAIGAGFDVGWAIGSGTNVNYIPPQWRGNVFDNTHTHYVFLDLTPLTHGDLLESMIKTLRHHGYVGRAVAIVSEADVDDYMALSDRFVQLKPPEVQFVGGNAASPVSFAQGEFEGIPGELFGYYNSTRGLIELRFHERFPAGYAFMTRPFGPDNAANGLAVRVHPSRPFGMSVDPQITRSLNPRLEYVKFTARFGVGVNNRLNGVAGYIADGAVAYVNPTIE